MSAELKEEEALPWVPPIQELQKPDPRQTCIVMPVRCFTCQMPLNHLQVPYLSALYAPDGTPSRALDAVGATCLACRTTLQTSVEDARLKRPLPRLPGFATPCYRSLDDAPTFTLSTRLLPASGSPELSFLREVLDDFFAFRGKE